jgi:hypothetical protein
MDILFSEKVSNSKYSRTFVNNSIILLEILEFIEKFRNSGNLSDSKDGFDSCGIDMHGYSIVYQHGLVIRGHHGSVRFGSGW